MVWEFEERAESLGHRSLVKDAAKFAEDLGVNLHLKHPDPVCAVKSGEIIPSHRVKEVLKECVEEKLEREVRGLEWQRKLLIERKSDSQLCKNGCFSWLSKWKSCPSYTIAVFRRELNLPEVLEAENEAPTVYARNVKQKAKHQAQVQLKQKWEDKSMHGQYPKRVNEKDVDQQMTNQWLKSGGLKSETEGFIIAAQDQAIKTNYYRRNILNDGTDPMCRICGQYQETIDHIVAGCPELAKTEYLHRHDKAASYLHWNICKELNINVEEKWYEHEPQTVTERDNITILWDMPIQTDREIKANRPDIVMKDKQEKSCLLIDMSIPTAKNTLVKITEKLSKYKDLEIEIERMWGMRATTIPVVIGALGLIKKGLEKYTKQIQGNIKISELQKIALLVTSRILRKTLS
ncbi:uncharacterized protein LOC122963360, partial [Acropora millepora]|uniref:uncharacterized protein LOC122963360 n=1 Tax=Acropora millepora TaxID=45264 RepID=UPI001CF14179